MHKDGRPTVYGKFGQEVALLVGDALLIKGFLMLTMICRCLDGEKREGIMNVLKRGLFELGEAEVMELRCRGATDIKPKDYLKIMRKKAADVEALMRLGAMLGNAKKSEVEALGKYGRILGLISILRDDIIDMTLPEELRHRLEYECLPLPLLYALQDAELHAELLKLIRNRVKTDSEYARICSLAALGLEKATNCINELAAKGKVSTLNVKERRQDLQLVIASLADLTEYGIS
jgi:geranylgeranyl pyrophosphate synthase